MSLHSSSPNETDRPSGREILLKRVLPLGIALTIVVTLIYFLAGQPGKPVSGTAPVRVMSYSSFVSSWGPGPEIAKAFEAEYGIPVSYQDAGDAGLLLQKLELFPADVVLGFDQLSLPQARATREWRQIAIGHSEGQSNGQSNHQSGDPHFVAFDKAAMSFVFRQGEVDPPVSLEDLLDARFRGAIALQDPRTSTPGLQFLFWILDELGIEEGFAYLERLKPNIHSVSASWSSAYGLFTKGQTKTAFSYVTSPVYHWIEEKDDRYQAAVFHTGLSTGHPVQVEYAAVPASCVACLAGEKFARFLLRPDIQSIVMRKNFMMPVMGDVARGTAFEKVPIVQERAWRNLPELLERREEFFERWRRLGL